MSKKTLAFVVYPGISLLELVGNHSLLGSILAPGVPIQFLAEYDAVVVGERMEEIATDTPLSFFPQKTFADVEQPEALVVIGGGEDTLPALENATLLEYVRRAAQHAEWVAATSTGALILAATGLLQGCQATTHWAYTDRLETYGVRLHPDRSIGWVTDGKFTTAAGVSGALDMALGLGARLRNRAVARFVQLMFEYDPHPPLGRLDWTTFEQNRDTLASLMNQNMTAQGPAHEIAFVIYPDLTVFDLAGPLQVFSSLHRIAPQFHCRVLAEQAGPVLTDIGVRMLPNGTFADLPHPDVLIVPGGDTPTVKAMSNLALRQYLRTTAGSARWIASVCTGALLLASVGLLKGYDVTTHWAYTRYLENLGARYVQKRWTANGNIINAAGISAGIDMALELVSLLTNEEVARAVQWLIHYDPQPPFGGIDYKRKKRLLSVVQVGNSLRFPFATANAQQLTRQGR